jgi:hypothetical protein
MLKDVEIVYATNFNLQKKSLFLYFLNKITSFSGIS